METINILTTLNKNYLPQLQVMLTSLAVNNPNDTFSIYLLHSGIAAEDMIGVEQQCEAYGYRFSPIQVNDNLFEAAPITKRYPKEMYYRLLAHKLLPLELERILYLDPDILVINPLRPLWETELKGNVFAAAAHTGKTELANSVNQLRLGTEHDYYNSGVLLMDLNRARKEIFPEDIFAYVEQRGKELILPDQDVLNAVYGERILPIDDVIWNYDARNYSNYMVRSGGLCNMVWVLEHTAILHFCGKEKPWKPRYVRRFGILYQHYAQIARREWGVAI